MFRIALIALVFALACGDDSNPTTDTGPGTDAAIDAPGVDAPGVDAPGIDAPGVDAPRIDARADTFVELVGGEWSLAGSSEGYVCVRHTVTETMFISQFRPVAPLGTHHTVLTYSPTATRPDGTEPCAAFTNAANMIYGSGVGTELLEFPEGVAIRLEPGNQLLLNLHLFNTDGSRLEGYSAIEVVLMDEADVVHEAEVLLAGAEFFSIPERSSGHEINGRCTMRGDVNVFAVMPHMHQFGTFMHVTADRGGEITTLHEDRYSFDDQAYTTFDAFPMANGDRIRVLCRYDNPTADPVGWGDSTLAEMCYAGVYRYPRLASGGITCTN